MPLLPRYREIVSTYGTCWVGEMYTHCLGSCYTRPTVAVPSNRTRRQSAPDDISLQLVPATHDHAEELVGKQTHKRKGGRPPHDSADLLDPVNSGTAGLTARASFLRFGTSWFLND